MRLGVLGLVFLAACAPLPPTQAEIDAAAKVQLTTRQKTEVVDRFLAQEVVQRCRSNDLDLVTARDTALNNELTAAFAAQGLRNPSWEVFKVVFTEAEVQDQLLTFIQKNGIVLSQAQTWCAAGERLARKQTGVGRFLALR